MGHYAFLDENNIVTEVITGRDENEVVDEISDWEKYYGEFRGQVCKRTSYNTKGNQHLFDGVPFRGNFAQPGYFFDNQKDVFIPPKPFDSWILDENTFLWKAPVEFPDDGGSYDWNEETKSWNPVEITDLNEIN